MHENILCIYLEGIGLEYRAQSLCRVPPSPVHQQIITLGQNPATNSVEKCPSRLKCCWDRVKREVTDIITNQHKVPMEYQKNDFGGKMISFENKCAKMQECARAQFSICDVKSIGSENAREKKTLIQSSGEVDVSTALGIDHDSLFQPAKDISSVLQMTPLSERRRDTRRGDTTVYVCFCCSLRACSR